MLALRLALRCRGRRLLPPPFALIALWLPCRCRRASPRCCRRGGALVAPLLLLLLLLLLPWQRQWRQR